MLKGLKIAQKAGIKHGRGTVYRLNTNAEITEACAIGMVCIGTYGIENTKRMVKLDAYRKVTEEFDLKRNTCLTKHVDDAIHRISPEDGIDPVSFIVSHNDDAKLSVKEIAAKLEACGL